MAHDRRRRTGGEARLPDGYHGATRQIGPRSRPASRAASPAPSASSCSLQRAASRRSAATHSATHQGSRRGQSRHPARRLGGRCRSPPRRSPIGRSIASRTSWRTAFSGDRASSSVRTECMQTHASHEPSAVDSWQPPRLRRATCCHRSAGVQAPLAFASTALASRPTIRAAATPARSPVDRHASEASSAMVLLEMSIVPLGQGRERQPVRGRVRRHRRPVGPRLRAARHGHDRRRRAGRSARR